MRLIGSSSDQTQTCLNGGGRGGEGADNSTKKLAWVVSLVCVYTNTKKNTDKRSPPLKLRESRSCL